MSTLDPFEQELIDEYVAEAFELIEEYEELLHKVKAGQYDKSTLNSLFRIAHNLKGSAYSVAMDKLGSFVHKLENVLSAVRDSLIEINEGVLDLLYCSHDRIHDYLEKVKNSEEVDSVDDTLATKLMDVLQAKGEKVETNLEQNIEELTEELKDQVDEKELQILERIKPNNILIVDDEPEILEILEESLNESGYKTFMANSAADALKVIASESIDLVLLDLKMPNITGVEFLRHLRQIDPKVSVVIVSGMASKEDLEEILNLGADGFIAKPFTEHQITSKVHTSMKLRLLRQLLSQMSLVNFRAYMAIGELLQDPEAAAIPSVKNVEKKLKKYMDQLTVFTQACSDI